MQLITEASDLVVGHQYWFRSLPHVKFGEAEYCPIPEVSVVKSHPIETEHVFFWNNMCRVYVNTDLATFNGRMVAVGPIVEGTVVDNTIFDTYAVVE